MAKQKSNLEIRSLMVKHNITQEQMAKRLGLGISTFNRKLNGNAPWLLEECKQIAVILDSTLDDLFFADTVTKLKRNKTA